MYPAAMTALAPTTVPTRWQPVRITAAVLCFVALVLAVASVFLPLYSGEVSFGGFGGANSSIEMTFTPWSVEVTPAGPGSSVVEVPHVGYPMVFAAVFLAGAACACWYAATPAATRSASRAAGVLTVASSAFLIGTAWTTATLVSSSVDYFVTLGTLGQGLDSDGNYLVGYWLLLTASLLAFTAAILSLIPTRQPSWRPLMPLSPHVPPSYGMPLPMNAPPQPAAAPPPGQVNPLTGHPVHIDPLTGLPTQLPPSTPASQGPAPGYPMVQGPTGPTGGTPFAQSATGAVDPFTGQPVNLPGALPFHHGPAAGAPPIAPVPTAQLAPVTTEPVGQVNGPPFAPVAEPVSAAEPVPVATPAHVADPLPSTEPTPVADLAPIVVPDAPSLPETPPGPAIPSSEDPLAEPPRS
jgi:hypothetical protein